MALIAAGVVLVLVWARGRDAFDRDWFALRTAEGARLVCVLVKSKVSFRPGAPAVIYCHGSGGTLAGSGNDIRQIAETGCAVLAIEYNQTNSSQFAAEIAAAHDWLARQSWVNTNRIVWAGMSLGAQELLSLTLNHPKHKPALLVRIVGGMVPKLDDAPAAENTSDPARKSNTNAHLDFPVLLFQAEADEVFPLASGQKVAERLRAAGTSVELITLPELTHRMEPDRAQVYRLVGEKILDALQRNH
jgi:acetyl esterase/lipase